MTTLLRTLVLHVFEKGALQNRATTYYQPPPATTHDQAKFRSHHPRSAIILSPPPTTNHNFTPATHNQSFFTATTHIYPRPTIIKSPLPTNNDSLPTNLLAITNSELYFCHHYSPSKIPKLSKFIRHHPPNTEEFSFSECRNSFHSQFTYYWCQWRQKSTSNAILCGYIFVQINFFRVWTFKNKFQSIFTVNEKICINLYISKYVYMIYSEPTLPLLNEY